MIQRTIDGFLPLGDQQNSLQYAESAGNWQLVSYGLSQASNLGAATGESQPLNIATFEPLPVGEAAKSLILEEVRDSASLTQVIANQASQGRGLVLYSSAYVSGAITKMAIFR